MTDSVATHTATPRRRRRAADDQASTLVLLAVLLCASVLLEPEDWNQLWAFAAGVVLMRIYRPLWRGLGLLPYALTLVLVARLLLPAGSSIPAYLADGCLGLAVGGLSRGVPARTWSVVDRGLIAFGIAAGLALLALEQSGRVIPVWCQPAILAAACVVAWLRLYRNAYEIWVETWARCMYRIHATGPGLSELPRHGPVLVIANHACWWDPLFIASHLARPITPMMTSAFYDIWHLRPFVQHVIGAIRVPDQPMRRAAPELAEAIAALDNGEVLVIFPEGYLRRKDDVPLRRFGRGVHEILKARPATPVVPVWIEGGWRSWCSWWNGPPTKNKRFDIRRRIEVGFAAPVAVPAEVLEDHWRTRIFLMNAVGAAREVLGLDRLPEFPMPGRDDTDEDNT